MNKETKIKLLKNAIRTSLNIIKFEINETTNPTDYQMLEYYNRSYIEYVGLLNKVANDLEMTYLETIQLEAILQARLDILLEA